MKKYLIVITGSPRGGQASWESLIKNVKTPLLADLALCYGDQFELPSILKKNLDYDWKFKEPKNWRTYFEENFSGTWEEFFLLGSDRGMAGGIDKNTGSGAIVSGLKDIVLRNHLQILEKYKYIIHTRFDQMYTDTHPSFEGDNIWIPEGEDYFGVCDRHAIFPSIYARQYFGICNFIDDENVYKEPPSIVNPESVFFNNLIYNKLENKVKRIPRFQFTASSNDDTTRWRKAIYRVYFRRNLLIKYPDEFITSIKNYIDLNGVSKVLNNNFIFYLNYKYINLRRFLGLVKGKLIKPTQNK